MKIDKQNRFLGTAFIFLLVLTGVVFAALWSLLGNIGIGIHDTIYMANPNLGPDGWIKYSTQILELFKMIVIPLLCLLATWILACGIFVCILNRKRKETEQNLGGDAETSAPQD